MPSRRLVVAPALSCLATAVALIAAPAVAAAEPLTGSVLDGMTLKPIKGAVVTAPGGATATTDKVGSFRFDDLPAGPLALDVVADGYDATVEQLDLVDGGIDGYIIVLFEPGAASEIIEIEDEAPVPPAPGRQDLGRKELTRIPGARGDALTAIRNLPGIGQAPAAGSGPGQLVIRGSAPEDSKITIDGIEVPVLYHFFGFTSVLPSEFIENIEYLPGGFGAEEGRSTGGVVNVTTRTEAVSKAEGFAELSFIDVSGFVQAPLSKAHGVQLTAAMRRSTIDLILPVVIPDSANIAFTTAPQYYDGQLRVDWRAGEHDKLSVLGMGSFDLLSLLNDNINPNEPDFTGAFDNETSFTKVIGQWLHGAHGLDNRLVVSAGTSGFRVEIGADRYLRANRYTLETRDDLGYKVGDRLKLRAGAEARLDSRDLDVRFPQAPAEGQPPPGNFSTLPLVDYMQTVDNSVAGAYVAADLRPTSALTITSGVRLDQFFFLGEHTVSPRLQVSQAFGKRWTAKMAMGAYSRGLEFGESVDPDLEPEKAFQYVLGGSHELRPGVTAEVSGFYTDRRNLVTTDALKAKTDPLHVYVNRGIGRSFGGEALVRAKLDNFFGWLAYSVSRSDRVDGPTSSRRLFDYDQTHNLVAVASYTLGKWQFGGRFQYATGTPVTPVVGSLYLSDVNAFVPVYGAVNSDRLSAAHQLDLRIDRKWKFDTWSLSAYLDVTNVYYHARTLGYSYNYDYTERTAISDLPIVPALGVRGEM
ncbi:MAG: TonB-dependent receptor [Kofleriaceae bacterium]|nr:TonB-dependent receptor [Myxococcales bacterium]MCB9562378.1 TonB-dependent receptor [Kofleriaceae bacterium]